MKELNNLTRATAYLCKIFDYANADFFEGVLSRPTITIQSTPDAYGHFVLSNTCWSSSLGDTAELNIGAGTLGRPIEQVVATMIHEMVHYYCFVKGIKDTSRNGMYHNKRFKEEAEKRGLLIEHHETYGFTITHPADACLEFCLKYDLTDILIQRNEGFYIPDFPLGGSDTDSDCSGEPSKGTGVEGVRSKPSHTRKYQCPICKCSVRATKTVHILCMDCNADMEDVTK